MASRGDIHNRKSEANKNLPKENLRIKFMCGNLENLSTEMEEISLRTLAQDCNMLSSPFKRLSRSLPFSFHFLSSLLERDYHNIHGNYFYFNEFFPTVAMN
jgi:hypothetical protein